MNCKTIRPQPHEEEEKKINPVPAVAAVSAVAFLPLRLACQ